MVPTSGRFHSNPFNACNIARNQHTISTTNQEEVTSCPTTSASSGNIADPPATSESDKSAPKLKKIDCHA